VIFQQRGIDGARDRVQGCPQCNRCHRPVTDNAYLCLHCTHTLETLLGNTKALVDEWTATYTRQGKSEQIGARTASTAIPWNDDASKAMTALRATLTTSAMLIHSERVYDDVGPYCNQCRHPSCQRFRTMRLPRTDATSSDADASVTISRWLLHHTEWLRHHPAAPQALDDIKRATADINHVMDNRAERRYAGPCMAEYRHDDCECACHRGRFCDLDDACWDRHVPHENTEPFEADACCLVELYARPDLDVIVCRSCKTPHNVAARQGWLLEQAQDQLMQAEHIGRALASLGKAVTPDMIRGYALRKRIIPHGWKVINSDDGAQRKIPLYRVGEVIAVVHQIAVENERKQTVRERKKALKERVAS
jgi:hypothetical protein